MKIDDTVLAKECWNDIKVHTLIGIAHFTILRRVDQFELPSNSKKTGFFLKGVQGLHFSHILVIQLSQTTLKQH